MSGFLFVNDAEILADKTALLLRVPSGIREKSTLLEWYRVNLRLPDYFGANWDALEECLRDLSWIEEKKIIIAHEDIPLSDDTRQQEIYLDVLKYIAGVWEDDPAHDLILAFNPACRDAVK